MPVELQLNKQGIIRKDTFRNYIRQRMAEVVAQVKHDPNMEGWGKVDIGATALDYEMGPKGPRWSIDVGKLDVFEDNLHAQQWFVKRYPNKSFNQLTKPHQVDATLRYVDEFLESLPQGVEVNIKGHAIRNQGGSYSNPTLGSKKDKLYKKRWGNKPGFTDLGEGKGMTFTNPVTRKPKSGAPNEWIEALSHEDYRFRKRLNPDTKIANVYGDEWGVPRKDWWHVEASGGGIEGRLKSKNISYDNLKSGYRRAIRLGQTPKMNAWEWQAIDELYKYAQEHGYHVDHKIPLEAGKRLGRTDLHKWDNLQVLDKYDNLVKGAKETVEGITPKMTGRLMQGPMDLDAYKKYTKIAENAEKVSIQRHIGNFIGGTTPTGKAVRRIGGAVVGSVLLPLEIKAAQESVSEAIESKGDFVETGEAIADVVGIIDPTLISTGVSLGLRSTTNALSKLSERDPALLRHIGGMLPF